MAVDPPPDRHGAAVARSNTRRAVLGSTVGSTIEAYDFLLYGIVAALVFPAVFFPEQSPYTGVLLAFSVWFIGFLARPLGAAIFGHLGDRVGRKKTLVFTMLLMGVGTVGIGLIPSYESIGPASAFLLVGMRLLQGLGFGGEWGGANLLAMESGSRRHRGLLTSFPQAAAMLGLFLANVSVFGMNRSLTPEAFASWGWRVPFVGSAVLIAVGLWVRFRVLETAEFRRLQEDGRVERAPLLAVFRHQPVTLLLCTLVKVAEMVPIYIFISFVFAYGTGTLGLDAEFLTLSVAAAALLAAVAMPAVGHLSDRIGHERMYQIGAATMVVFAFVYFAGLSTGSPLVAAACIVASLIPYAMMFGAEGAILGKSFAPAWRYTGSSLAFNLAGIIGGGPAPFIATWLLVQTGNAYAIAAYIVVAGLVGFAAVTVLRRRAAAPGGELRATPTTRPIQEVSP
ncbi:MFS transporter [Pseudonocardia sp. MH-G8]|uniref:MFS transporter n=1 Tax=Pseudonocardia sp. MH-G8 TaxID=1854588 RepID=UPI000BA17900|nr:MFS transporter [Pseudonocardia sp. MH-G8]OZM80902.1 MFS transporter [Pseudonocardia sp. MH-G8]